MKEYRTNAQKKTFYNSRPWRLLRGQALKRDNFECQECKRLGYVRVDSDKVPGERKSIELNVHHKKEIETHPELALKLNNLETLCLFHHNQVHDKGFVRKKPKWNDEKW